MRVQPARAVHRAIEQHAVVEQARRRHERRIVPDLPVGHALVIRRDERHAWRNDPIAHARTERRQLRRRCACFENVERDGELQQPDRLEIRAEKRARWSQYIVGIGIAEILIRVPVEQRHRRHAARLVIRDHTKQGGMEDALGEPHLIPVQAKAIVQTARMFASARRAHVSRIVWIEAEQRAVDRAAAARAAQQRLLAGHLRRRYEEWREVSPEPLRQRRELTPSDRASRVQLCGGGDQRHGPSPREARRQS